MTSLRPSTDGGTPTRSRFTPEEQAFLAGVRLLGRLATVDRHGVPHLVPVGWRFDPVDEVIEVSGRDFAATKKFRNAKADPRVAFLVDEVLPPWQPRAVLVRGTAEAVDGDGDRQAMLRIRPAEVVSWGL